MRKIRKVNERKVQFDWDETDDTAAADTNPLYAQRHEAQLYGRGHFGGIDIREQRSKQNFYDSIVQNRTTMADSEYAKYCLYPPLCCVELQRAYLKQVTMTCIGRKNRFMRCENVIGVL